jgi:hypothetical protein
MKSTLITSTLAALSLAAAMAAPAFAARPDGFDPGDASGVYLWHRAGVDHGWHLETTDPRRSGAHTYTGSITTDGAFNDVRLVRPESDDSATVDGSGTLNFSFKTYSGIDGVDWRVSGGRQMTFTLYEDGQLMSTSQINIGDNSRHPDSDPFTVGA